jgi:hypothetical protein
MFFYGRGGRPNYTFSRVAELDADVPSTRRCAAIETDPAS